MSQFYTRRSRDSQGRFRGPLEGDGLPDGETFYHDEADNAEFENGSSSHFGMSTGWYWWACFPGCLPDGDPIGPFVTEEEAMFNARSDS
jgi:hypothetical protein